MQASTRALTLAALLGGAAAFGGGWRGGGSRGKEEYTVHHINETITPTRCGETTYSTSSRSQSYTMKKMASSFPLEEGNCADDGYTVPWTQSDANFFNKDHASHPGNVELDFGSRWGFGHTKINFFKKPSGGSAVALPNIVGLAVKNQALLGTLVAAVKAAGLVGTLSGTGPFTVFAPTDAAFKKLGSAVGVLLKPENKALLVKVLTYHVVAGKVFSESLQDGQKAKTVEGQDVTVTIDSGSDDGAGEVKINNAVVVSPDLLASNGVVHVIDSVLLFPGFKLPTAATDQGTCKDTGKGQWGPCADYKSNKWCTTDGTHTGHAGNGWVTQWGTLDASATAHCCQCGGGLSTMSGGKGSMSTASGYSTAMNGWCRVGNSNPSNCYRTIRASRSDCEAKCTAQASCKGFESAPSQNQQCELWTCVPTSFSSSGSSICKVKTATTAAAGSSLVYTIGGGKCGECLVKDTIIAASGGKAGKKGTCASQGYTTKGGSTTVDVPHQGKVECAVFTDDASSLVYTLGGGKCGECLVKDTIIAASGGKAGKKGTCASQGFSVAAGSTTVTVPHQGKLECAVFTAQN